MNYTDDDPGNLHLLDCIYLVIPVLLLEPSSQKVGREFQKIDSFDPWGKSLATIVGKPVSQSHLVSRSLEKHGLQISG